MNLISGNEFLAQKMVAGKVLVDPIIPDPARIMLAGFAGVGKSTLAMNMAAAISAGLPFLGWETQKKTVIYVDGENPLHLVQQKTAVIFNSVGGDINNIHFLFPEEKLNLCNTNAMSALERSIMAHEAGLVVLDSFLNFFTLKNENDATETRAALDGITLLLRRTGCSVLILDHTAKPLRVSYGHGISGPPTPRGSGTKVDFADVVLVIEEKNRNGGSVKTLHFTKLRGVAPMSPILLEMDGQYMFRALGEDARVPVELVREVVKNNPGIQTGQAVQYLEERTNAGKRTIYLALDRAEERGLIFREKKGRNVFLHVVPDIHINGVPLLTAFQQRGVK
jgi:hypothetical protein